MKSKSFVGAVTAAALFATSAFAADIAPLPAGKPAGAKEAAFLGLGPWVPVIIAVGIAGFIAAAATGSFANSHAVPATQGFQATP